MPWTFAHPAAVLILRRRAAPLSFAGLVVGSIAPDVGYYVGRFDLASTAHTLVGLLTVCLPVGLVLVAIVRAMRRSLAYLLPQLHRAALLSLPRSDLLGSAYTVFWLSLSVLAGAATHNVWDSFTYEGGYVVRRASLLQQLAETFAYSMFCST